MRSGSDRAVQAQCTQAGYQSLLAQTNAQEPPAVQWRRWSDGWLKWGPIRWQSITALVAYGKLGPNEKEVSINFVLTDKGWKLDQWSPAD